MVQNIYKKLHEDFKSLENCSLCPRKCLTNRFKGKRGYCRSGSGFEIASISLHRGEEPVISGSKGICNVFFSHCNLQCVYCQNYQISERECRVKTREYTLDEVVSSIISILESGVESLGFVSPTHMVPQMRAIIDAVHQKGLSPFIVYNTNAYDSVETLQTIEDVVDVYLPDFKYSDPELAMKWSDAPDYPQTAGLAIREMYRQKGNTIRLNENGIAENGLIVRHLVLPGSVNNSLGILRYLAEEVSTNIALSLMSQYYPIHKVSKTEPLNRKLHEEEYWQVKEEMENLGFTKGWVQDFESADFYLPDFEAERPF
jgi:putative pyruvate formate lyase activating enzyme